MLPADASNTIFTLAADFVNNTSRHIFLTGKAGTGKTTFLRYIKEHTQKHTVVIAPTGVAAINAGGVTMHSFFQLPFSPFLPVGNSRMTDNQAADRNSLFKNIRFNADKRELLEELELLIIDEISMVRADMLDAMDAILRHFRKKPQLPFGGVQVLYIGDMYQLPPVVSNNEWELLHPYYESPFFFSAHVIAAAPPLYIELKKIYRQNEQPFIEVLNRVRNNQVSAADFALLNNLYQPAFMPPPGEKYITVSSHNKKAELINAVELEKLPGRMMTFNGTISGDFSDKAFPTEPSLQLKEGAQVMFIKNDSGIDRKYFNGKLATIKKISIDEIIVTANDDNEELKLEKETWRNLRYTYHKESNSIKEEELGSFTQYPIRLAWAITIHKSQGLSFERAIIDAGASFAAGQVYVALSRCTSLQGLVLLSKLHAGAVATDPRVIAFAQKEAAADELQQLLEKEQQSYWHGTLVNSFSWRRILTAMEQFNELVPGKKLPDVKAAVNLAYTLLNKAKEQAAVAEKFQSQLQQILLQVQQTGNSELLQERVGKAVNWFVKALWEDILQPLRQHLDSLRHASKVRKYVQDVSAIEAWVYQHLQKIMHTRYNNILFFEDAVSYAPYAAATASAGVDTPADKPSRKNKPVKGGSQTESLALFREGKAITEIASLRQLAESTILGHLSAFVKTGELQVLDLLPADKVNIILPVVKEVGGDAVTPVKEILGADYSYTDIRIVMNHWQRLQAKAVNA